MNLTIEEQQERGKAIKLLIAKWIKSHDIKPKVPRGSVKNLKPQKRK
jgi:hypothetical protein